MAEEKLTPEEEAALRSEGDLPPEEKVALPPEGEETGEVTETPEETIARLEKEKDDLSKESAGRLNEIINLRDRTRAAEIELGTARKVAPPVGSIFGEKEDEDVITVKEAKAMQREQLDILIAEIDQQKMRTSEKLAKREHKDYDKVVEKFQEMARLNPTLGRIAYFDPDPAEYMYQRGLTHPDLQSEAETKAKADVIGKITKPKPKLPTGGGGRGPERMTLEKAADLSPEEWEALPEAERAKLMREAG